MEPITVQHPCGIHTVSPAEQDQIREMVPSSGEKPGVTPAVIRWLISGALITGGLLVLFLVS